MTRITSRNKKSRELGINFKEKEIPSRFLVNLNLLETREEAETVKQRNKAYHLIRSRKEIIKNYILPSAGNVNIPENEVAPFIDNVESSSAFLANPSVDAEISNSAQDAVKTEIAVFSLFKLFLRLTVGLFRVLWKINYGVGWVSLFFIKFVWLAVAMVFRPLPRLANDFSSFVIVIVFAVGGFFYRLGALIRAPINRPSKTPVRIKIEEPEEPVKHIEPVIAVVPEFKIEESLFAIPSAVKISERPACQTKQRLNLNIFERVKTAINAITEFDYRLLFPRPRLYLIRNVMPLFVVMALLALPVKAIFFYNEINDKKGRVLGTAESAIGDFAGAARLAGEADFTGASLVFAEAGEKFDLAKDEVSGINRLLLEAAAMIPESELAMAAESENLLSAGQIAADLGQELSDLAKALSGADGLTSILNLAESSVPKILDEYVELNQRLAGINSGNWPAEMRGKFDLLRTQCLEFEPKVNELNRFLSLARNALGFNGEKKYLLAFQNNAEIRGSGGFIGSFALAGFIDGKMTRLEAPGGGSYDTEAGLKENIVAPEPLHLVNPLWHFWDANWWPDWSKSADKLEWFYEKSDGPTVDGVIAFNPSVAEKIIALVGSVDMTEKYGVVINKDNFWEVTQRISETKTEDNKPKKFIGDLMDEIVKTLPGRTDKAFILDTAELLLASLREKSILLHFNNPELEKANQEYGWNGAIRQTGLDYLSVVNTNIGGGKSDRVISQTISHEAAIGDSGEIIVTATVARTHNGNKEAEFTGIRNVNYMRVYVPAGSKLIAADGFLRPLDSQFEAPDSAWKSDPDLQAESNAAIDAPSGTRIYEESGKTVFANWTQTDPGETTVSRVVYILPFKLGNMILKTNENSGESGSILSGQTASAGDSLHYRYTLLVQKQPGADNTTIKSALTGEGMLNSIKEAENNDSVIWTIEKTLSEDEYWKVEF